MEKSWFFDVFAAFLIAGAFCLTQPSLSAQVREEQGKSIGKVSTIGELILLELHEGALGKQNLFDLNRRTVRFTPSGSGYRIESLPLQWDSEFGEELEGSNVTLKKVKFPFSGKTWESFSVGGNGSIRFGGTPTDAGTGPGAGAVCRSGASINLAKLPEH